MLMLSVCIARAAAQSDQESPSDTSTSSVISAIVLALIMSGAFMSCFLCLRPRNPAVYQPKTYRALPASRNTEPLPKGLFNWVPQYLRVPDTEILRINGLDSYLFIWFLVLMLRIFVPIWIVSWIVLMPLYAANLPVKQNGDKYGRGEGFNMFIFGNVVEQPPSQQTRSAGVLVLHYLIMAWVVFNLHDGMRHFIRVRKEFLTSAEHRNTNQAKTFLVTSVPNDMLSETKMKELYSGLPGGVKRVWINRNLKELPKLVEQRDKLADKQEGAVCKLITAAAKKVKKGKVEAVSVPDGSEPSLDVADRYVPEKKRPHHRLGKVPCIGEKVDTINYSREELPRLNREIEDVRQKVINDYEAYPPQSSAFIMCNTMQGAYTGASFRPVDNKSQFDKRYVEMHPNNIVWKNMNFNPYERKARTCCCWGVTWLTVLFWTIPVAVVSLLSNVDYLSKNVSFLSWIDSIPNIPKGIIKAVLPTAALAILNSLLPPWLRYNARMSGMPTTTLIELSLMKRFFIFVVIQNFILLTIMSGIQQQVNEFKQAVDDPVKFVQTISSAIPRASQFFLQYIFLMGLSGASGMLLQLVPLILRWIKLKFLGSTPRKLWHLRNDMGAPQWGVLFPTTLFITVIAFAYMMIQPVMSGFASVTFFTYYLVHRYMFLYVFDVKPATETAGEYFLHAIHYTLIATYLSALLVALMFLFNSGNTTWFVAMGVLTIVLGFLVGGYHIYMYIWYKREMAQIPDILARKEQEEGALTMTGANAYSGAGGAPGAAATGGAALPEKDAYYVDPEQQQQQQLMLNGGAPQPLSAGVRTGAGEAIQIDDPADVQEKEKLREIQTMNAFFNPARLENQKVLWYPNDNYGIGRSQVAADYNAGYLSSVDEAFLNDKYKIDEDAKIPPGEKHPV